jgi:hypothetical protein
MQTYQRKKLNDYVSFPQILNMNHFLDTDNLKDKTDTDNLIKNNPLLNVRPADFKAAAVKKMAQTAKSVVQKTATEKAVDEQLKNMEEVAEEDGA